MECWPKSCKFWHPNVDRFSIMGFWHPIMGWIFNHRSFDIQSWDVFFNHGILTSNHGIIFWHPIEGQIFKHWILTSNHYNNLCMGFLHPIVGFLVMRFWPPTLGRIFSKTNKTTNHGTDSQRWDFDIQSWDIYSCMMVLKSITGFIIQSWDIFSITRKVSINRYKNT